MGYWTTSYMSFSLQQLQQREPRAWTSLYDYLAPDLRSFALRIGARDPDDIVSETMLGIVRDIDSFTGTVEEIRPWAFTIARHRVIDASRKRQRRPDEIALSDTESINIAVTQRDGDIDLGSLATALEQLTDQQREVLWLRYALDFSLETTADIVGSTPDAVSSMAYRALSRLRIGDEKTH